MHIIEKLRKQSPKDTFTTTLTHSEAEELLTCCKHKGITPAIIRRIDQWARMIKADSPASDPVIVINYETKTVESGFELLTGLIQSGMYSYQVIIDFDYQELKPNF